MKIKQLAAESPKNKKNKKNLRSETPEKKGKAYETIWANSHTHTHTHRYI